MKDHVISWTVLEAGLRNMGIDPHCGSCMEIFFTGLTIHDHTHAAPLAVDVPPHPLTDSHKETCEVCK